MSIVIVGAGPNLGVHAAGAADARAEQLPRARRRPSAPLGRCVARR